MPVLYSPAPQWKPARSRYIRLYHGCTSHDAKSIQTHGIDPMLCRRNTDFGRGFYTTTVRYQARQWAWARFYALPRIRPNQPVVFKFVLDRHQLADLKFISFVLGGYKKQDFWSLVQHCRQSTPKVINDHRGPVSMPDGTKWYDIACGPVAAFWRQKYAMLDADQFSFHTTQAVELLNQLRNSSGKKRFDVEYLS